MPDPKQVQDAKQKLIECIQNEAPFDGDALTVVTMAFEKADTEKPCPCGSGRIHGNCCRADWMVIRRHSLKRPEEKAPLSEGGNGKDDQDRDGVRWFCQVGRSKNGAQVIRPLGFGRNMDPLAVAGELLLAYHAITCDTVLKAASEMAQRSMMPNRGGKIWPT